MSHRSAGRIAGILFLSAFVLYGVGNALSAQPVGLALMLLNSAAVATIGAVTFRPLQAAAAPQTALVYVLTRVTEAVALAVGVLFLADGNSGANDVAYAVAMVALGAGSVPFCLSLARHRLAPRWLALWGAAGYALLVAGMMLELALPGAGVVLAIPGGLFEIVLGILLLVRGSPATRPAAAPAGASAAPAGATAATAAR